MTEFNGTKNDWNSYVERMSKNEIPKQIIKSMPLAYTRWKAYTCRKIQKRSNKEWQYSVRTGNKPNPCTIEELLLLASGKNIFNGN